MRLQSLFQTPDKLRFQKRPAGFKSNSQRTILQYESQISFIIDTCIQSIVKLYLCFKST